MNLSLELESRNDTLIYNYFGAPLLYGTPMQFILRWDVSWSGYSSDTLVMGYEQGADPSEVCISVFAVRCGAFIVRV